MNLIELNRALRQLRLGGIAAVLEMRLHQAQVESMAPIDLISCLVSEHHFDAFRGSFFRPSSRPSVGESTITPGRFAA